MTTRPILFSGPMVRALLDGRKTQTRRIVNARYLPIAEECLKVNGKWVFETLDYELTTPYGTPGDLLWVRETTAADHETSETTTLARYVADDASVLHSGPEFDEDGNDDYGGSIVHWWGKRDVCPSIHMPRRASRLTLEITGVRVERLREISHEDALAEGAPPPDGAYSRKDSFMMLWNSINGPGSWEANPWVWVLEFKVHPLNVDELLKRRAA